MEKRWVIKQPGDERIVGELAQVLNIDPQLSNLLVQRGIHNFKEAKDYFRPDLSDLHDPFLMKDMDKAVQRIRKAIDNNEKILIYGDYDVDGTTAVALIYTFFHSFHFNLDFYIPDRYAEGYGISYKGIDYAVENNFSLVIVLDCGIKAIDKINYANERNLDFIICDHHRPGDEIPSAYAVLDPKRSDCSYPYKELSGCGVGFKLIQAYSIEYGLSKERLDSFLDLVVVSIAADIVPITGENRILAYYGLKLINRKPRPGFEAILHCGGIDREEDSNGPYLFNREITISDIVFLVGPRINAAGRIENANNSVELLITSDRKYADQLADQINNLNIERKSLDLSATQEALEFIQNDEQLKNCKSTVVFNSNWHKGVIGIVASRLTEYYYRPTVVLTQSNGFITGSARSIKDFDIYDAVDYCSDLLEHFGGHKYAAGLSLRPENLQSFKKKFEEYVLSHTHEEMLIPEIEIDSVIQLNEINLRFFKILKQLAPFGPGNMAPIFQTDGVKDTGNARKVGKNHLKLEVFHPDISVYPIPAIAFQQGHFLEKIHTGKPFSICYHLEENEWNGKKTLQLNIKDIKFTE